MFIKAIVTGALLAATSVGANPMTDCDVYQKSWSGEIMKAEIAELVSLSLPLF